MNYVGGGGWLLAAAVWGLHPGLLVVTIRRSVRETELNGEAGIYSDVRRTYKIVFMNRIII